MVFDTSVLENRVFGLIKAEKLDKSIQFIDTLRFLTKAPNPDTTKALNVLFEEVATTAKVFGIDLKEAKGTFAVNYRDYKLYEPSIGSKDGIAVISWGTKLFPMDKLFSDEAYLTISEVNKGIFQLNVDKDGQRGTLKLWTKKGKKYTKSQMQVKLDSPETLGSMLEPVKLPTTPFLQLKAYLGKTLHVKSLEVTEGGEFGATGALEFYEFPGKYYRANANAIGKLLRGYMGEELPKYTWSLSEHEFYPKEVRSGQMGDYLHYDCLNLTGVSAEEEWSYSEETDELELLPSEEEEDFAYADE